jgi:hypothetical protein
VNQDRLVRQGRRVPSHAPPPAPSGHWVKHEKCWNDTSTGGCDNVGVESTTTLAQCEAACLANPSCNAINIDTAGGGCILRACPMAKLEVRTS